VIFCFDFKTVYNNKNIEKIIMNELLALAQNNPLPVLQLLSKLDPISVREQVCSTSPHFFFEALNHYHDSNGELTRFCLQNGYNPKQQYTKKVDPYGNPGLVSIDKIGVEHYSDYIHAWKRHSDKVIYELTLHVGQDYIRELDAKGVPLLLKAYEKGFPETVKLLTQWGINPEEPKSMAHEGYNLHVAIGNKTDMQQLYFSLKNSTNQSIDNTGATSTVDELQFKHISQWIHTEIEKLQNYKDDYHTKKIIENMAINLPTLNREQQEQIIAKTLIHNNTTFYKKALDIIGEKVKSYRAQFVQPWSYLSESPSHQFVKLFLEQNVPLDSYDSFKKISYIESLSQKLKEWGYRDGNKYDTFSKSVTEKMRGSVQRLLLQNKDSDFWLMSNPQDDNQPWFLTACKSNAIMTVFGKETWLFTHVERLKTYMDDETQRLIKNRELECFPDPEKINYHQSLFLKKGQFTHNYHSDKHLRVINFPGSAQGAVEFETNLNIEMDYLRRTWLFKDNQNQYAIEYAFKNSNELFAKNSLMDNQFSSLIKEDMTHCLFTLEEKTVLFRTFLDKAFDRFSVNEKLIQSATFTALFDNLKATPDFDWSFINLNLFKNHKEDAPELISELSYLKLNHHINNDIGEAEDSAPAKMKI
jgi:hypothetical protein